MDKGEKANRSRVYASLIYALTTLSLVPLLGGVLLICVASTANGRLVGLACISFLTAFILMGFTWLKRKPRQVIVRAFSIPLTLSILLLALVYWMTPDGRTLPGAPMRQIYLNGGSYHRASLANLVPEVDQFNLGLTVLPYLGLFVDHERGDRVRRLFQSVYQEMDASPEFGNLGSNMNYAYRELFSRKFDVGHTYVYIPQVPSAKPAEKMPVILFLHGSLGNFKGYMWVLKQLADRRHCAIVAPSFGLGNWGRKGGVEAIKRTRRWTEDQPQLDSGRIYLACLSNGGRGMMQAAIQDPQAYRGLISISGRLNGDLVRSAEFGAGWSGRPALILQGKADELVPEVYVRKTVDEMTLRGVKTTYQVWPNEDHFLLFGAKDEVIQAIGEWLNKQEHYNKMK